MKLVLGLLFPIWEWLDSLVFGLQLKLRQKDSHFKKIVLGLVYTVHQSCCCCLFVFHRSKRKKGGEMYTEVWLT